MYINDMKGVYRFCLNGWNSILKRSYQLQCQIYSYRSFVSIVIRRKDEKLKKKYHNFKASKPLKSLLHY